MDINCKINNKNDIRSLLFSELEELVLSLGEKKFRAGQIFDWLHNKLVSDFSEMKNVPKALIEKISENYSIYSLSIERVQESKLDGTRKYLFKLDDGNLIESVYMIYEHGISVCVSSQVGCRMGCRFCASTIDGVERNLTSGEILGQIYEIIKDTGKRVSNVVIMGSGEPFDNFHNVINFLRLVSDEKGQNISGRNITVSTCGLVPKIYEFAELGFQATLAISLHASSDEKRKEIMPVANKYSIKEIIEACEFFFEKTGRRLTFEYSLIKDVNDTKEDSDKLIKLLKKLNCHVNLIPVNPIKERDFVQSEKDNVQRFRNELLKGHVNATVRREMGRDIDGACGQLRRRVTLENNV